MKDDLYEHIGRALRALLDEAGNVAPIPEFALDPPRQAEHGDFACNAAMLSPRR